MSCFIIDPRYEWSIYSGWGLGVRGPGIQTPAKLASDWLESQLLIG